jgi:hypothetical protein
MKLRFIARHMMYERIAPLEPTSAPVTMRRSLPSMKPVAAPPTRVAVQHRDHHRHVGAADRHHHVHAEESAISVMIASGFSPSSIDWAPDEPGRRTRSPPAGRRG